LTRDPRLLGPIALALAAGCAASRPLPPVTASAASAAPAAPRLAPVAELAERVARVRAAFQARGAHPFAEESVMFLRQGNARGVTLRVDRPQCLGFTVVGMPEMGNLDLRVLAGDGVELGHDTRDDAHPYARACVTAPTTVFAMASAVAGTGEVALLAMADPPPLAPPLGDVLRDRPRGVANGVRTPRGALGRDPSVRPPAQAIETALASLGARGYRREGSVVNGNMPRGRSEQHPWDLAAGHCYTAIAFGGERVEDIDLVVRAPSGEIVAQDVGLDARPQVTFCAADGGPHAIELRLFSGSGEWSLAVAEAPAPDAMLAPGALPDRLRAGAVAIDADARAEGWVVAMPPLLGVGWIGAEHRVPVTLRGGHCYRYAAVASSPPGVVDLWLARADGALLTAYTGARSPAQVWTCPARTTRAVLHARTPSGRGEFALWGYRQEAPR
jgi:hypothetical protein